MVLASQAQHGMWITEVMHHTGTAYHMPFAMWFDGPLDREAMLAACEALVARHPILASAFEERDGRLRVVPAASPPPITFLAELPDTLISDEIATPFELGKGPLARFTLAAVSPSRHLLLFVGHHLVFDGMSKDVLVHDLAALYAGKSLPPLPISFGDAAQAEAERIDKALPEAAEFWRSRWREVNEVVISGRTSVPKVAAHGETVLLELTDEMSAAHRGLEATRFEVFLSAVHAVLYRYGNAEISVAIATSTRNEQTRGHVGLFATELPVFSAPSPDLDFHAFAQSIRGELRGLNRFREVPLARAIGRIRPRTALAPVSISFRRRAPDQEFPGLAMEVEWKMSSHTIRNALHLQAVDGADGLHLTLHYSPDVVPREDVERFGEHLRAVLSAVAADPGVLLSELPLPVVSSAPAAVAVAPGPAVGSRPVADEEVVREVQLIWQEVLRMDEVGLEEDLYDLGGHSLTITQISARIRKRFDVEVPFDVFLDDPTITGVAAVVSELRA